MAGQLVAALIPLVGMEKHDIEKIRWMPGTTVNERCRHGR
jgi:hypothetical protein